MVQTVEVLTEYSDATPSTTTSSSTTTTDTFVGNTTIKEKIVYLGNVEEIDDMVFFVTNTYYQTKIYNIIETVDVSVNVIDHGSYIETITTTTTTESIEIAYEYKIDEQTTENAVLVKEDMFIYLIGSGEEELDALMTERIEDPQFYPIIPLRLNNVSIRDSDDFEEVTKAYKKLNKGASIDKLIGSIEDNENIGDIDYVYLVLGLPINSKSKYELKYIYKFFQKLISYQSTTSLIYNNWFNNVISNKEFNSLYKLWRIAQSDPDNPLYNTPRPVKPSSPNFERSLTAPERTILAFITAVPAQYNINLQLRWDFIDESLHVGLGKPDAYVGEVWWVFENSEVIETWYAIYPTGDMLLSPLDEDTANYTALLFYQVDADNYKVIRIHGLEYRNYVYGDNYESIHLKQALNDEDKTGFIIPLHEPTLKSLSKIYQNEISVRSQHLIFNTYKIHKAKWYQTGLFQVALFVVLIVINALVTYFSAGTGTSFSVSLSAKILAINLAVATVTQIIIVSILASLISLIAATIIQYILTQAFELVFDDKTAALLATIGTIVVMVGISTPTDTGNFGDAFTAFASDPTSILLATISVADVGIQYINTMSLENDIKDVNMLKDEYTKNKETIEKNNSLLKLNSDNSLLTDMMLDNIIYPETSDTFLNRSLLNGSDVVNFSRSLITDFVTNVLNNHKLNK